MVFYLFSNYACGWHWHCLIRRLLHEDGERETRKLMLSSRKIRRLGQKIIHTCCTTLLLYLDPLPLFSSSFSLEKGNGVVFIGGLNLNHHPSRSQSSGPHSISCNPVLARVLRHLPQGVCEGMLSAVRVGRVGALPGQSCLSETAPEGCFRNDVSKAASLD